MDNNKKMTLKELSVLIDEIGDDVQQLMELSGWKEQSIKLVLETQTWKDEVEVRSEGTEIISSAVMTTQNEDCNAELGVAPMYFHKSESEDVEREEYYDYEREEGDPSPLDFND